MNSIMSLYKILQFLHAQSLIEFLKMYLITFLTFLHMNNRELPFHRGRLSGAATDFLYLIRLLIAFSASLFPLTLPLYMTRKIANC
jgi:hypothetical protein